MEVTDFAAGADERLGEGQELALRLAHDIRSPLTAICSYADCLVWLPLGDRGTREEYARAVVCEARRIDRLLSDYLVLAGVIAEEVAQAGDAGAVLREALAGLQPALELRGQRLSDVRGAHYPAVWWPLARLRQVFQAALDAVVSRAAEGQTVQTELTAEFPGRLVVRVCVDGMVGLRPWGRSLHRDACAALLAREGGCLHETPPPRAGLRLEVPVVAASGAATAPARWERIAS